MNMRRDLIKGFQCIDCGVDTSESGDYMIRGRIWKEATDPGEWNEHIQVGHVML
jgi:hypothetical protein